MVDITDLKKKQGKRVSSRLDFLYGAEKAILESLMHEDGAANFNRQKRERDRKKRR